MGRDNLRDRKVGRDRREEARKCRKKHGENGEGERQRERRETEGGGRGRDSERRETERQKKRVVIKNKGW